MQTKESTALFYQVESTAFLSLFCLHRSCEVIDWVSEDDQIYYITCPKANGDKPKDLVVLVSRRTLKDR